MLGLRECVSGVVSDPRPVRNSELCEGWQGKSLCDERPRERGRGISSPRKPGGHRIGHDGVTRAAVLDGGHS